MPVEGLTAAIIVNVLSSMVRVSTPLLLTATGELVTERSGVLNLGLEGTVLMGAFLGFWTANLTGSPVLAMLAAIVVGALMSLILVFVSVTLKASQSVTGLILNLLASGVSLFWYRMAFEETSPPITVLLGKVDIPFLSRIPYVGTILFSHSAITYFAFLMVPIVSIFLYRTRYGLRLRAAGENPRAVDMGGANITLYQYLATIFGGMMAGLGGAFLTLAFTSRFLPNMSGGRGWLAIVIVIAGNWKPGRIMLATLAFAFLDALQFQIQGLGVKAPFQLLLALPYIVAIVVMVAGRARALAPKALAMPYMRE